MNRRVHATARARRQIGIADEWWRANRLDAPALFVDELEAASILIADVPHAGRRYPVDNPPGVRRVLLPRTGYHVYYTAEADRVLIRAVWHAVRGRSPKL